MSLIWKFPVLLIFLILLLSSKAYSDGGCGVYYITGKAYSNQDSILRNANLIVNFRKETDTIQTDSSGNYEIKVVWYTHCRQGHTRWYIKRQNRKLNPKYILISYLDKTIKIENEWTKYGLPCFTPFDEKEVLEKDLYFLND